MLLKRALLVSTLTISASVVLAVKAASTDVTDAAAKAPSAEATTPAENPVVLTPLPSTGNAEHDALLATRQKQQQMVFHLQAKRDSELNRLALARLAAERGGDPDFNEQKNQKMLKQIRGLRDDYDRQLVEARAALAKTNAALARFEAASGPATKATANKKATADKQPTGNK